MAIIIIGSCQLYQTGRKISLKPGMLVVEAPSQKRSQSLVTHRVDDYLIHEVRDFSLRAKVLAKKNYSLGREADLSPTDLALGWGPMSDQAVLDKIKIRQAGRFYYWRVDAFPIRRKEIESHSANMHFIPANDLVRYTLKRIRKGDVIRLEGALVNVTATDDDWRWNSSLSRTDTGAGACELIWVEALNIITE